QYLEEVNDADRHRGLEDAALRVHDRHGGDCVFFAEHMHSTRIELGRVALVPRRGHFLAFAVAMSPTSSLSSSASGTTTPSVSASFSWRTSSRIWPFSSSAATSSLA